VISVVYNIAIKLGKNTCSIAAIPLLLPGIQPKMMCNWCV